MKLTLLLLSSIISFSAFALVEDVAIDPKNGDTIIVQKSQNPTGKIIFLSDTDQEFRQEISILPVESDEARFEIELVKTGEAVALVTINGQHIMKKIIKVNGKWEVANFPTSYGEGVIGNLSAISTKEISYNSIKDGEEYINIIDADNFKLKDSVLARLVRLKALELAPELEVEDNASPTPMPELASGDDGDEDEVDYRRSGMGFAAGAVTGLGISYRRHLANKWGYQFTGIPWASSSSYFVSLGANFMRTLHATKRTRFMAIGGISSYLRGNYGIDWDSCDYSTSSKPDEEYVDPCAGVEEQWNRNNTINIGVGIGMEFSLGQNIGLAIELPVVLMIGREFGIYPIPSVSLIYYF